MAEKKITETTALVTKKLDKEELALVKSTIAKDATDEELALFLYTAQKRGLNPLTRQIHFVKRGKGEESQGVIQTGIDGLRLIAQRTGQYAPSGRPTLFEYENGKLLRATVYGNKIINGTAFEFSATARFSEYAPVKANGGLFPMWIKMPETMLEKCAEAKMLRRGFPEELSGLYSDEEMEQAGAGVTTFREASEPEPGAAADKPEELQTTAKPEDYAALSAKYGDMLGCCWEHGDTWHMDNYGKRCHKLEDGSWCRFRLLLQPITKEIALENGMGSSQELNDYLKKEYGKTWSQFSEEEQIKILAELKETMDA